MTSQQIPPTQATVKKVLVKKIKVLVKRPIPVAPSVGHPVMVKVPVKRPVQTQVPQMPNPQRPLPASESIPQTPIAQKSSFTSSMMQSAKTGKESYIGQIINGVEVKPIVFELPDDILQSIEQRKKVTDKLLLLYIYARTYLKEEGYEPSGLNVELPEDSLQAAQMMDKIDDGLFIEMLEDFVKMAPYIPGMERIMANKNASIEQISQSELNRLEDQKSLSIPQQIIIAYLTILVDLKMIQEKLELLDIEEETNQIIDEIKSMEKDEAVLKKNFITAIERKKFPVDAKKLITNYFTLAKKDPTKAYQTLITNPLFFSPIIKERLPKKFFGLVKPSSKDAIDVNKKLASFLKNLKV